MARPQVQIVIDALEQAAERLVTRLTLEITANLKETTPVDTGWARANWIPNLGGPSASPPSPTSREGRLASLSTQAGQQGLAEASIFSYSWPGRVYVTNNVPYIGQLNDGSSQQAPAGFVQAAITRAVATVTSTP